MEQEKIIAVALALIAHELGTDPSQLQLLDFREVSTGSLDSYLKERDIPFQQYQLGDRT